MFEQTPDNPNSIFESLRRIARRERGVAVRIFVSLAATFLMVAGALVASFLIATIDYRASIGGRYFFVRDEHLLMGFAIATALWGAILWWIWRGQIGRNSVVGPLVGTALIAGLTIFAVIAVEALVRREEEYLIAAVVMLAGATASLLWMRYTLAILRGNPVLNHEHQVNVNCPECGYSLIGLKEMRCPECGLHFTVDELIRAQGYGATATQDATQQVRIEREPDIIPPRITPRLSEDEPADCDRANRA